MDAKPVTRVIAIDDDPTGSQTVHSCLLLTRWDPDTLMQGLSDDAPLFFVLSNTRGMDAVRAAAVTRDGTRYLMVDGKPVPVDVTEFARDSVFGFSTAFLPDHVEEKTAGRISARQVERFSLQDVRGDAALAEVYEILARSPGGQRAAGSAVA